MRKLLLLVFILLFFGINNSFSAWYGNSTIPYTNNNTISCPSDGDTTGGTQIGYSNDTAVTNNSTSLTPNPVYNTYTLNSNLTNSTAVPSTGNMYCLKWDGVAPVASILNLPPSWLSGSVTVNVSCSDTGGSGCDTTSYQYRVSDTMFSCDSSGTWITGSNYSTATKKYICSKVKDIAGNGYSYSSTSLIKVDNIAPSLSDIINTIPTNLLANNSYLYVFNIGFNGGSPINSVTGTKENFINESGTNISFTISNSTISFNWDINKVDNYILNGTGGREYTFNLGTVCDLAGNCTNFNKKYYHNVYSDSFNIGSTITNSAEINNLKAINIADGSIYSLNITLKDIYGNGIIPATGINRTIDFNFDIINTTDLNQYSSAINEDAIFVITPNNTTYTNKLSLNNGVKSFTGQTSSNGIYPFSFKVYAPTYSGSSSDGRQYVDGNFKIKDITFDINGSIGSVLNTTLTNAQNIDFQFKPIYTTTLTGSIRKYGFIEGSTQSGIINITENLTTILTPKLFLEFGSGAGAPLLNFDMQLITPTNTGILEGNGNKTYIPGINNFNGNNNISTLITQTGGVIANLNSSYLSTHIGYNILGPDGIYYINIIYNQDILGKSRYSDTATNNTVTQVGLKVLGKTFSDKQTNITQAQQSSNFNILGNISKASLRKDIVLNAYNIIKNITLVYTGSINDLSTTTWNNGDGKKLQNDSILYFWGLNGGNIILDTNGNGLLNPTELIGKKTIIVKGGNLYIKSNIVNKKNNNNNILGIIVLKDINGKGGKVYIDPDVTEIDAIIYADRSVISYDGTKELDGSTSQIVLKNQLYIYGSMFSNNTIGGSRTNPLICPYYITGLCDRIIAQTYDFNYLRRYFLYDTTGNGIGDTPANFGTSVLSSTDPNYKYPIIIKYNPTVQISPPPLFYK